MNSPGHVAAASLRDPGAPAQPMRIAMVMPPWFDVPPQAYGGIESLAADLADSLVGHGHTVFNVGAGQDGTRAEFRRDHRPGNGLGPAWAQFHGEAAANSERQQP